MIRLLVTPIGVTPIWATPIGVTPIAETQHAVTLNVATRIVLVVPSAALVVTRAVRTLAPPAEQEQAQVAIPNAVALTVALGAIPAVPTLVQTVAQNEAQTVGSNAPVQSVVQVVTPDGVLHEVPRRVRQVLQCVARA